MNPLLSIGDVSFKSFSWRWLIRRFRNFAAEREISVRHHGFRAFPEHQMINYRAFKKCAIKICSFQSRQNVIFFVRCVDGQICPCQFQDRLRNPKFHLDAKTYVLLEFGLWQRSIADQLEF